ncbi:uncharacterized protein LOC122013374 isoform X1 [Zingiber officinale]|uniref:uncharacterized protein LOC122013374 isoform X1 n=1 Tax=Zingiber officinale TaxID=94328 RepID=UPI001C4C4873|nr:uncharacterized protein LOC122013374 isoform X1 [Zingiber officinale]
MEVRVSAIASTSTRSLFLRCSCENSPFMFSSGPCCLITSSIGWEVFFFHLQRLLVHVTRRQKIGLHTATSTPTSASRSTTSFIERGFYTFNSHESGGLIPP